MHPLAALAGAPVDLSRIGMLARVQQCAAKWMRVAMWCAVYLLHRIAMGTADPRQLSPAGNLSSLVQAPRPVSCA